MKIRDSIAIVLQVTNLHDRDRIVSFLTAEYGVKRGVAQGARTKFSRFQGCLQSLCEVQISWVEKAGRDLVRIQDASLIRGVGARPTDLERMLAGQYFAESMERFTMEDEASEIHLRLMRSTVGALTGSVPLDSLLRYFEVWLLQINGIFSLTSRCPACGRDFSTGAVLPDHTDDLVCRSCGADHEMAGRIYPAAVFDFVRSCGVTAPADLGPADPRVLAQLEDLTREIRRRFLGRELRSYEVMKQTLAGLTS